MSRARRTIGDVRVTHVISYGTTRLTVTCVVPAGEGRVEISGYYVRRGISSLNKTGATFRAGVLREVVIHNWSEGA